MDDMDAKHHVLFIGSSDNMPKMYPPKWSECIHCAVWQLGWSMLEPDAWASHLG